jgi:hypothetical protein
MKTTIRMKHPLRSVGTHQTARLLRALAPGHFRLDERSMQDLITAAHSYARMLTYVAPGGQNDGDWAAFWEVENLTYMAVLAAMDTEQLRKGYEDIDLAFGQALQEELEKPKKGKKSAAKEASLSADFTRQLLCYLRDMAAALEKHYATLRPEIPLKALLLQLISRDNKFPYEPHDVDSAMQQLVAFHKAADDHLDPETYKIFFQPDSRWGIRNRDEYDCILPDETYDRQKIRSLFVQLFNISLTLKARAQQMFDAEVALLELPEETLERRLEPHIALFITFLQLFRHAQEGMNDIPRRHLDFYYHSVLCLERRPADPDHAYLIFTLAKEFSEELVGKDTLISAGKDKKGRPIQFETLERWRVTKASVEEIRNTCIAPEFINASTISEKGVPPEKAFRAFGDDATAPEGELGFAIASPQLFLLEGKREVEVRLELEGEIEYANVFAANVYVQYSTGEGYHSLPKLSPDIAGNLNGFVFNPVVSPFEPLKTIEPVRRLIGELTTDEVKATFSVGGNSPHLQKMLFALYNRYNGAVNSAPMLVAPDLDLMAWFQAVFYYPALSGVYLISRILDKENASGEIKLESGYHAELHFYRAYYLWCLATVCQPAPQFSASQSNPNSALNTKIPKLTTIEITPTTPPFKESDCFTLQGLYDQVHNDLLHSLSRLTGKTINIVNDLSSLTKAAPQSNTSINIYTVSAMLSRYYMHLRKWSDCLDWCRVVTESTFYDPGEPMQADKDRKETAERIFKSIFEEVGSSKEIIWAMNAIPGDQVQTSPKSLFAALGSRDLYAQETAPLFFAESALLNEVNKQNLRYDERTWFVPSQEDKEGEEKSESQPLSTSGKAVKKSAAQKASDKPDLSKEIDPSTNPYDFRDAAFYRENQQKTGWYTSKYFPTSTTTFVPMIRLAEVMLNEAWCILQVSSSDQSNNKARQILNTLRERAGALPFKKTESTAGTAHVLDTILPAHIEEERMRELAFEGDRRDFVRLSNGYMANRDYFVNSTDVDVRTLGGDNYLDSAKDILILTPQGRGFKSDDLANWASPWLYMADLMPQLANTDRSKIKELDANSTINLSLTLKEDAPPFLPDQALAAAGRVPYPILRVTFDGKDQSGKGSGFYNFLKKQTLTKATIKVSVAGIQKNIVLQNDFGVFDGTQRFYPFGPVPENSARFFLGCQEAFTKKLDSVTVTFDWVEEEDIANGKKGYEGTYEKYQELATDILPVPIKLPTKRPFPQPRVTIDLLKEAEFSPLLSSRPLFDPPLRFENSDTTLSQTQSHMVRVFDNLNIKDFVRTISSEQVAKYSSTQKRGFLRFRLEGDFGHRDFGLLLTKAAAAQQTANLPKEPYTPATNTVSLTYVSTQVMESGIDQFFHVLPFEGGLHQADFSQNTSLVYGYPSPAGEPDAGGFYPANLFLGIKNLLPGDNLSLLFQASEGSELDFDSRPPTVHWMYLSRNNDWLPFPVQKVLRDTTRGLTRTGLLQLATPNDPGKEISSAGNTMLNPALLWLRAAVVETAEDSERVAAFPSLLSIQAQALEARFLPAEGNDLERLDQPLPAQSVSGLTESSAAIKKVEQPFASFGGRKPETEGSPEYHRRISERLRHKDRAVTAWDYERLLLEQYPLAAIAKCIPHTRYEDTEGFSGATELAPGFVTLAIVPDLLRRPNMVRTEPRFSRGDLEEMRDFLLPKVNGFVQTVENKATGERTDYLQVVNPKYEKVSVAVKVWLVRGADQNLAKYELDQSLRHYFAPWLKDPERLPQFSRVVRRSHLIQLIEQLEYVDAIETLSISDFQNKEVVGTLISPSTARSILTTGQHSVEISTGVGGLGGPAPRAALAPPPAAAAAEAPEVQEPAISSLETPKPKTGTQRKASKRK